MPGPVVIDVGDAEPQRDLVVALVEACTQAAAPSGIDCRLVRDAPDVPYTAIAIVTWEEGGRARVEVGVRRDPVSEWRTRELTFQVQDAEVERFRSVGFVIGSLATAAHDEPPPEATPAEPPPPPLPPPVPTATRKRTPEPEPPLPRPAMPGRGWIGLAGTIGGGLDRGAARYGGRLGAGVRIVPHLAGIVSVDASFRARDDQGFSAQWLAAGGGLAFAVLPPEDSHFDLRVEVLAEQFTANVVDDGEQASSSSIMALSRLGADAVLFVAHPLSVVLGGEAAFRRATTVTVHGERVGATRNFELGATAGLRLDL